MRTQRIEAFSDGVFAIAITLLALDIKRPDSAHHLSHDLARLWPSYTAYVISFLLIGLVWANHHVVFDHIRSGDRMLLFLNVLLLMDVAVLPFPTSVLALALRDRAGMVPATVLYGSVLTAGGVLFNAVYAWARHRDLLHHEVHPDERRRVSRRFWLGPLLYGVATVIAVFSPITALVGYALLILFYWLPPTALRRLPV